MARAAAGSRKLTVGRPFSAPITAVTPKTDSMRSRVSTDCGPPSATTRPPCRTMIRSQNIAARLRSWVPAQPSRAKTVRGRGPQPVPNVEVIRRFVEDERRRLLCEGAGDQHRWRSPPDSSRQRRPSRCSTFVDPRGGVDDFRSRGPGPRHDGWWGSSSPMMSRTERSQGTPPDCSTTASLLATSRRGSFETSSSPTLAVPSSGEQSGQDPHERRLAGSVGSDDAHLLTRFGGNRTSSRIVAPPADTVMFAHPMATGAFVIACSPFARREAKPQ